MSSLSELTVGALSSIYLSIYLYLSVREFGSVIITPGLQPDSFSLQQQPKLELGHQELRPKHVWRKHNRSWEQGVANQRRATLALAIAEASKASKSLFDVE